MVELSSNYRVTTISGSNSIVNSTNSTSAYSIGLVYHPYDKCVYYIDQTKNAIIQIIKTPKNTLIQNATGREITITVPGGTVTNSTMKSLPGIPSIKTLYSTSGTTYTVL